MTGDTKNFVTPISDHQKKWFSIRIIIINDCKNGTILYRHILYNIICLYNIVQFLRSFIIMILIDNDFFLHMKIGVSKFLVSPVKLYNSIWWYEKFWYTCTFGIKKNKDYYSNSQNLTHEWVILGLRTEVFLQKVIFLVMEGLRALHD